jgi:probable F420-dependent oxidoreductase
MHIGVIFPQTEIPSAASDVRRWVEAVAAARMNHVMAYDHVLGADPSVHVEGPALSPAGSTGGWNGAYTHESSFHEPFVLFGHIAAIADIGLATGILILPQRQTVLVAKQAAAVDVLCGGKLRLGVGLGWNAVEYEGLGMDFNTRGKRVEEQIELLRKLWTEPAVDFVGEQHRVTGAGINPLPIQRPIPVWMGARPTGPAIRRVGRVADGWIPNIAPGPVLDTALETMRSAAHEAGRDPSTLGLDGRINVGDGDLGRIEREAAAWRRAGATHVSLNTLRSGLRGVDAHVEALTTALAVIGD